MAVLAAGAVLGLVALVGYRLPLRHRAIRSAAYGQPLHVIWEALADPLSGASWRPDVRSVERLPDRDGRMVWRERDRWGGALTLELLDDEPPRRRVVRIADPSLPFGGTWTYELAGEPGGARLTITEDGEVRNALFRFVGRFLIGQGRTIETFLVALGRRFGEDVVTE